MEAWINQIAPQFLSSFSLFGYALAARPRFIEQYFGMDTIYRFHAWTAVAAVLLAYIHSLLKVSLLGEAPRFNPG